jgi:hypothetical protein
LVIRVRVFEKGSFERSEPFARMIPVSALVISDSRGLSRRTSLQTPEMHVPMRVNQIGYPSAIDDTPIENSLAVG